MSIITKQEDTPFFDTGFDAHPRYLFPKRIALIRKHFFSIENESRIFHAA